MNLGAERGLGADTPGGALLRAAVAGVLLVGLLIVAMRDDEAPQQQVEVTPEEPSPLAVAPLIADPVAEPEAPEPVPADGAPSGEAPPVDELPVDQPALLSPERPAQPATKADETPSDEAPPAQAAVELEPPNPTALGPSPPAVAVADARIVTVIPTDAAPGEDDPPPPPAVPAVDDHRVRLGGFMPIAEAHALQQASVNAGYPARILHRVMLGPFDSRGEARAALKGTRGILIGGGEQWWVQLGVFADADNAEGLREKMVAGNRVAVIQGRVELGPFAGRTVAEQVLIAVRDALGRSLENARVIAP